MLAVTAPAAPADATRLGKISSARYIALISIAIVATAVPLIVTEHVRVRCIAASAVVHVPPDPLGLGRQRHTLTMAVLPPSSLALALALESLESLIVPALPLGPGRGADACRRHLRVGAASEPRAASAAVVQAVVEVAVSLVVVVVVAIVIAPLAVAAAVRVVVVRVVVVRVVVVAHGDRRRG